MKYDFIYKRMLGVLWKINIVKSLKRSIHKRRMKEDQKEMIIDYHCYICLCLPIYRTLPT